MARPLRLDFEGALWHVTARGNERKDIFRDDVDRDAFVRILASVVKRYGWILHGWVLMPNHYHLVVETPQPTLSAGMMQLGAVYTQAFNRRWNRAGHLFQGRFFSLHVQRESHLLELLRYTALNPVRAGLASAPGAWQWGSFRATAGLEKRPAWLETEWVLSQFSGRGRAETSWARFVSDTSDYSPWGLVRNQVILGEDSLMDELRERATETRAMSGVPSVQRHLGAESLDHAAKRLSGLLRPAAMDHDSKRDRALAAVFLRDACLATYAQIGELTGITMWGARSLVDRGRQKMKDSPEDRRRYAELAVPSEKPSKKTHKTQP
jgi:REP element-mobilizing transposase RayT